MARDTRVWHTGDGLREPHLKLESVLSYRQMLEETPEVQEAENGDDADDGMAAAACKGAVGTVANGNDAEADGHENGMSDPWDDSDAANGPPVPGDSLV